VSNRRIHFTNSDLEKLAFWDSDLDSSLNFARTFEPLETVFGQGEQPVAQFKQTYKLLKSITRLAKALFTNPPAIADEPFEQTVVKLLKSEKAATINEMKLSESEWEWVEDTAKEWKNKDDVLEAVEPSRSNDDTPDLESATTGDA
jgi:hypothetical protein